MMTELEIFGDGYLKLLQVDLDPAHRVVVSDCGRLVAGSECNVFWLGVVQCFGGVVGLHQSETIATAE